MKPVDILLALLAVITWGSNFVVIKIGLQSMPPLLFTSLRFIFTALPLALFVKPPPVRWRWLFAYGIFQFALQFTLLFTGMQLGLSAGLASLVMQLHAFFTIGLAALLLGERPLPAQLIGAAIAFAGMLLVAVQLQGSVSLLGFFVVIAGSVSWAIANLVTKRIGRVNPLQLVVWGSLLASPPLVLASLLLEGGAPWLALPAQVDWRMVAVVLFQAYPNTVIGFGIWSILLNRYSAATVVPYSLLVPVTGMLAAALILGEPLQWWKIVAGGLVLTGLALNQFGARLYRHATRQR